MPDRFILWEKHLDALQAFYEETQRSALLADPQTTKETWLREANEELKTMKRRLIPTAGTNYNGIHLSWWRPLTTDELTDHGHLVERETLLNEFKPKAQDAPLSE